MNKKIVVLFALAAVTIILLGLLYKPSTVSAPTPMGEAKVRQAKIGNTVISIEIADTDALRTLGLGKRDSMPADQGMWFVFPAGSSPSFWMKDMRFSLDFIWIADSQVVKLDENVPAPASGAPDSSLQFYNAGQPITGVLEVNAGFVAKHSIKVGDSAILQ